MENEQSKVMSDGGAPRWAGVEFVRILWSGTPPPPPPQPPSFVNTVEVKEQINVCLFACGGDKFNLFVKERFYIKFREFQKVQKS